MGGVDGRSCTFNCAGGTVTVKADKGSRYYAGSKTVAVTNGSTSTVNFALKPAQYTLTVKIVGSGKVESPSGGISCGNGSSKCSNNYYYDTQSPDTTLTATASSGSKFLSWTSGQCSSPSGSSCPVNMDGNKTITATFETGTTTNTYTLSIEVSPLGAGSTTPKSPGTYNYNRGAVVSLSASTTNFITWQAKSGKSCPVKSTASSTTTITMNDNYDCVATYKGSTIVTNGGSCTFAIGTNPANPSTEPPSIIEFIPKVQYNNNGTITSVSLSDTKLSVTWNNLLDAAGKIITTTLTPTSDHSKKYSIYDAGTYTISASAKYNGVACNPASVTNTYNVGTTTTNSEHEVRTSN